MKFLLKQDKDEETKKESEWSEAISSMAALGNWNHRLKVFKRFAQRMKANGEPSDVLEGAAAILGLDFEATQGRAEMGDRYPLSDENTIAFEEMVSWYENLTEEVGDDNAFVKLLYNDILEVIHNHSSRSVKEIHTITKFVPPPSEFQSQNKYGITGKKEDSLEKKP